jgi:endoglucanase
MKAARAGIAFAFVTLVALGASPTAAATTPLAPRAFIRVSLVGYAQHADSKRAYVLSTADEKDGTFDVVDSHGSEVLSGLLGASAGDWNAKYPFVYAIDFGSVTDVGTYTIEVDGPAPATSPEFVVAPPEALYRPLLANAKFFYEAQRDGTDVDHSVLKRKPSHLNDAHAASYLPPDYRHGELHGDLVPTGGPPVDALGGWFDAGDYVKFVQTASYTDAMMLAGARDFPSLLGAGTPADFAGEGRFGIDWLLKMWDDASRTLYYQVGIGDGNGCGSICGDHDIWRLPEKDDTYGGSQAKYRYIRNRPVFRAGKAGSKVSPNLAGRLAAAFGLCSQVFRASDPAYADSCLTAGEHVFALADTTPKGKLLTVSPHGFYPETQWRDDLEFGATELSLAVLGAGGDGSGYLKDAAHWASEYLKSSDRDSLNLYDVSGFAHADLYAALPEGLEVSRKDLLKDLRRQLDHAEDVAKDDPFGDGFGYGFDVVPHLLGLGVTAAEVDRIEGDDTYAAFGEQQVGFVMGSNAWGTSFIIGDGSTFPNCPQHQVANLVGSLDGSPPVLLGAGVNGPNHPDQFKGLGLPAHARDCPPGGGDPYKQFSGHGARYMDDARAWPSVEPADDYTVLSLLAFAHLATGGL